MKDHRYIKALADIGSGKNASLGEMFSTLSGTSIRVRAGMGASGVMFTLDTESGFRDVVLVTAACGLGEHIVGGAVNPDEFLVYKPALEQGHSAIMQRRLGDKKIKMVYAADTVTGPSNRNVEVHPEAQ